MKTKCFILLACLLSAAAGFAQTGDVTTTSREDLSEIAGQHEPPMLGIHWARGFSPFVRAARGSNPDMTYHGGVIIPSTVSEAIFWGTSWASYSGDKMTGLDSWYSGSATPVMPRPRMSTPGRMAL